MLCIITRKSRASIWGKLHHCQTYLRHFSHRRNYTVCSSRDSFAYSESHHDSYPQFPRSSLGTHGLQTRSHRQKKETPAFLESRLLLKQARLIREMRGLASLGQAQPLGGGRKGLRYCGIALFLVRCCSNFYFKLRYCGFQGPSGVR